MVNSVCDTCTSFATRLRFDLYTFWEIFWWVWLWSLCVQQFWACEFMVSLCLLLSVRWGELRWGEVRWGEVTSDGWYFGSHLVAEFEYISLMIWKIETETELMYVREWLSDRSIVEWGVGLADDRTAACLSVSPYQRLLRSAILYTNKLCRVCIWLCSVIDSSSSVVCWLYCVSWSFPSSHLISYLLLENVH